MREGEGAIERELSHFTETKWWTFALAACAAFHLTLSLTFPDMPWTTPAGVGSFAVLAMTLSVHQAFTRPISERWRWLCLAASFFILSCGWALLAYLDGVVKPDFRFVQLDTVTATCQYIPLMLVIALNDDFAYDGVFRGLDIVHAMTSIGLVLLLYFPIWLDPSTSAVSDAQQLLYRYILRTSIAVIAISSLIFGRGETDEGNIKFFVMVAVLLIGNSVLTPITNIIIPHAAKGTAGLMIIDLPLASVIGLTLYFGDHPLSAFLSRKSPGKGGPLVGPIGLTALCLILAILIGQRHPFLGLCAGLATFTLAGIRFTLVQNLYVRSQELLAKVERSRADFLADISHDIRSPLTSVSLSAAALVRIDPVDPVRRKIERSIKDGCEHVVAMIDDMLLLTLTEAQGEWRPVRPRKVRRVTAEAIALVRPQAEAARVALDNVRGIADETVIGDAEQLRRVLINLLTNAIRFTPPGGEVILATAWLRTSDRPTIRFMVTDTGIGIPLEAQASLLNRSQRARMPVTGAKGIGMGLLICRSIARQLDGRIGFDSTPGSGSRFWIDLPHRPFS